MEQNAQPNIPAFLSVRHVASSLNTNTDPQDLKDTEAALCLNTTFDGGYPSPRKGSSLLYSKPSTETGSLLNTLKFQTSNRIEYLVAVYGANFWLRDTAGNGGSGQWIPLNGGVTPANTTLNYGYVSWNNGVGDDRGYFGNGTDATLKWSMALNYLSASKAATDTTLDLTSAAQFPKSGGTVIIQGASAFFTAVYTSITNNTLNLTVPLGQAVGAGAAVTMAISNVSTGWNPAKDYTTAAIIAGSTTITLHDASSFPSSGTVSIYAPTGAITNVVYASKAGNVLTLSGTAGVAADVGAVIAVNNGGTALVPIGKLFGKFQGRLVIANASGYETTMWYSNVGNPEDYTIGSTPSAGGFYGFIQGIGELTGVFDFGLYLGVLKGDSMHRFEFSIDATNATKIDQVTPLISDNALGCLYPRAWIKKNNTLYYPSLSSGILSVAPIVTGFQTSIQLSVLSQIIQNYYRTLDFTNSHVSDFETKILWSCSSVSGGAIDTVLVYDTMLQYWTVFNNWAVKDWFKLGANLCFGNYQDGCIYECFDPSMTDNNVAYTTSVHTKRFDGGMPSLPKTATKVFVQGFMNTSTKLYCDVLFNEQGQQQKITYLIDGTEEYVIQPITPALAQAMLGVPLLEDTVLSSLNSLGIFKVYLNIPIKYGWYNIQFRFYTIAAGANWSVTGIGYNPRVEIHAPATLAIDPSGEPVSTAQST